MTDESAHSSQAGLNWCHSNPSPDNSFKSNDLKKNDSPEHTSASGELPKFTENIFGKNLFEVYFEFFFLFFFGPCPIWCHEGEEFMSLPWCPSLYAVSSLDLLTGLFSYKNLIRTMLFDTQHPNHVKIFCLGSVKMVQSSSSLVPLVSHSVQQVHFRVYLTTRTFWSQQSNMEFRVSA